MLRHDGICPHTSSSNGEQEQNCPEERSVLINLLPAEARHRSNTGCGGTWDTPRSSAVFQCGSHSMLFICKFNPSNALCLSILPFSCLVSQPVSHPVPHPAHHTVSVNFQTTSCHDQANFSHCETKARSYGWGLSMPLCRLLHFNTDHRLVSQPQLGTGVSQEPSRTD